MTVPTQHHFVRGTSEVTVAEQGAHLLSWKTDGVEQLYLSPFAVQDGSAPIRGGVPVCFPQFNQRGSLPKHGFARILPWKPVAESLHPCFEFISSEQTRQLWPFDFVMRLRFELAADALKIVWSVHNTGLDRLSFTGALHTYLRIESIDTALLYGLQGQTQWDAVQDGSLCQSTVVGAAPLDFKSEFDRVYTALASDHALRLTSGSRVISIRQSDSLAHTVVWNPHLERCAGLVDMPPLGYQNMLCIEAAQVLSPIDVAPGEEWTGWQQLIAHTIYER